MRKVIYTMLFVLIIAGWTVFLTATAEAGEINTQPITIEQLRERVLEEKRKLNRAVYKPFIIECRSKGGVPIVSSTYPGYAICFDRSMFGE